MHFIRVTTIAAVLSMLLGSPISLAADTQAQQLINHLANFRFDQLGNPQIKTDSIKPVSAPATRPHRLLVVSVEFTDLGYDRFAGDKNQRKKEPQLPAKTTVRWVNQ